jgi:hypothetical protein
MGWPVAKARAAAMEDHTLTRGKGGRSSGRRSGSGGNWSREAQIR